MKNREQKKKATKVNLTLLFSDSEHLEQTDPHFEYIKPYSKRTDFKNKKARVRLLFNFSHSI